MKGSLYRKRDYAFGQTMLTLRNQIGLTQASLAERLHVSRKAVGEWEGSLNYPIAEHLKAFIALAVEQQAWAFEREEEEIRALWQATRQKVPLDETWLAAPLSLAEEPPTSLPVEKSISTAHALTLPAGDGPRVDWGDALAVTTFYGRVGCAQRGACASPGRASWDGLCRGLESDRHSAGQWGRRWHAALVGRRARRVRTGAPGAPGDGAAAPGESRWQSAGQLRGRRGHSRLGVGERRTSAYAAARPALRAARYHGDQRRDRGAEGIVARVGGH